MSGRLISQTFQQWLVTWSEPPGRIVSQKFAQWSVIWSELPGRLVSQTFARWSGIWLSHLLVWFQKHCTMINQLVAVTWLSDCPNIYTNKHTSLRHSSLSNLFTSPPIFVTYKSRITFFGREGLYGVALNSIMWIRGCDDTKSEIRGDQLRYNSQTHSYRTIHTCHD